MKLLTLSACLFALVIPASASALIVGIGEQQRFMFGDARFHSLGIRYARISIAWDTLAVPSQAKDLDRWLRAAEADGVHPLISFEASWRRGRHNVLPTPGQLVRQFSLLHRLYPWVTDFATWNEANFCGQPTCHRPGLVAAYYRQMRKVCPACNVVAAELLDVTGMTSWVASFQRALHYDPAIWGLHNYVGANRLQAASTRALLGVTRGRIWFSETAGLVARHNHSAHDFPESAAHAAAVTRFIFDRLARLSGRIQRVYLYQWTAGTHRPEAWDSALLSARGALRPAFWVLVSELGALRLLPRTGPAQLLLRSAGRSHL